MTNIGKRGLYVIDEPENSLHAPLLSAFMYVLRNVLVEKEAMAIIATHSPIVLREVPKNAYTSFNLLRGYVALYRRQLKLLVRILVCCLMKFSA